MGDQTSNEARRFDEPRRSASWLHQAESSAETPCKSVKTGVGTLRACLNDGIDCWMKVSEDRIKDWLPIGQFSTFDGRRKRWRILEEGIDRIVELGQHGPLKAALVRIHRLPDG